MEDDLIFLLKIQNDDLKKKPNLRSAQKSRLYQPNIRQSEKYEVNFANTERLKTGSVIMMQKYLNEDNVQNKKRKYG